MKTELSNFISICDNSLSYLTKDMDNINMKLALNIADRNKSVIEFLKDKIRTSITPQDDNYITRVEIESLKRGLIYKELIEDKSYQSYIDILELLTSIIDSRQKMFIPLDSPLWIEIIRCLKSYLVIDDSSTKQQLHFADKYKDIANKAKELLKYGVKLSLNNCELVVDNLDGVYKFITSRIKKIGGRGFIEAILSTLKYYDKFDRYLIFKHGNSPIQNEIVLLSPYNYLINLGFRYLKEEGIVYKSREARLKDYKDIIRTSTNLCFVLYPVQTYSIWEDIFHKDRTVMQFFKDLIIKESVFELPQNSPKYTLGLCRYIVERLLEDGVSLLEYSLIDYLRVMEYLVSKSTHNRFYSFYLYNLDLDMDNTTLKAILDDLTIDCYILNKEFLSPLDHLATTNSEKPLVKNRNNQYELKPNTLGVWGFYEVLISKLRGVDNNIDGKIGLIIEDYIKLKLSQNNIDYCYGKYSVPNLKGECDIVVDSKNGSTKGITLIEVKKKSLTRKSKSGVDYQIIIDIAKSILDSQIQCIRTEKILRVQGYIDISNESDVSRLNWSNRNIESFTVTLSSYGAIQDKEMIKQVLTELRRCSIDIDFNGCDYDEKTKAKIAKQFEDLKGKQKTLKEYTKDFDDNNLFFCSYFLSLEQLLFIINISNGNDDFYNKITDNKFVTLGTQDFYLEYYLKHCLCK